MALSESEAAAADNVTDLAEARRTRAVSKTSDKTPAVANTAPEKANAGKSVSAKKSTSNRRFDKEKVERIKAEIADGSYEIDPLRVADKFIEYDR